MKKAKTFFLGFAKEFASKDFTTHAASTTFFLFLSLLPILILLSLLLPLTGLGAEELIDMVTAVTPDFIDDLIAQIIRETYARSGGIVPITLLVILWSAAQCMSALIRGLQMVYEVPRRKNIVVLSVTAILATLAITLFLMLSMVGLVFANTLIHAVGADQVTVPFLAMIVLHLRYVIMLFLTILLLTLLYTYISGAERKMRLHLPGAVLSAVAMAIFTWIFSVYVSYNRNYRTIYGSLAAFVVMLLWAYFCCYILLIGGSLNHYLQKRKEEEG